MVTGSESTPSAVASAPSGPCPPAIDPLQAQEAARELADVPAIFWTLTPEVAINLGYSIYLASVEPQGSAIREVAERDIAERYALFDELSTNLRVRAYTTKLTEAALSYARGLERAKRIYRNSLNEARERKRNARTDNVITATRSGLWRGGLRLAAASGTALFASIAVLKSVVDQDSSTSVGWTGLSISGFVLVFAIWFEAGRVNKVEREIYQKYDRDLLTAREARARNLKTELDAAFDLAERAYIEILGRPVPSSASCRHHLYALTELQLVEDQSMFALDVVETRLGFLKLFKRGRRILEVALADVEQEAGAERRGAGGASGAGGEPASAAGQRVAQAADVEQATVGRAPEGGATA